MECYSKHRPHFRIV